MPTTSAPKLRRHAYLSRGFVAWPRKARVNARSQLESQRFGRLERKLPKPFRIDLGHIRKANAEAAVERPPQWVFTNYVQVIAQADDRSWLEPFVHSAGRGSDDERAHAKPLENPHREGHNVELVPFVVMEPALEHDHGRAREFAQDHIAGVTVDPGWRKMRDRCVRHGNRTFDAAGQFAQPRAEDYPNARVNPAD